MFRQKLCRELILGIVLSLGLVSVTFGQNGQPNQNPQDSPRTVKPEQMRVFKDWVTKDVAYIITDAERRAFERLKTPEEFESFIERFWFLRDPDPDTQENEYKDEHYERMAYSNEHFSSGKPGWMTDRGKIYIKYGKPDEIESHPTGGPYERPSYHGSGSTITYPFEIWFYRHIEGISSGLDIEFVDPTSTGEYRLARSPEDKDASLNIPGMGLTFAESMGLEDKANRALGQGAYANGRAYSREQDSPFTRLITNTLLMSLPPQGTTSELERRLYKSDPLVEDNPLDFSMRVDFFRLSDDSVITAFTIQADNNDLSFENSGGIQKATLNIFGRITSLSDRRVGTFEDPVTTEATVEELTTAKERKSAYQKVMALAPGNYKIDLIVRDVVSGATGIRHIGFEVPRFEVSKLSHSSLILATRLEAIGDKRPTEMFLIGQNKVIPNVSGVYRRGSDVGVYMQVYHAQIDQTTLRPSVDVDYVLTKDGKVVGSQTEDWRGMSDASQRLTLARLLPTSELAPGNYKIEIRIRDRVSGQTLSPSAEFTLLK